MERYRRANRQLLGEPPFAGLGGQNPKDSSSVLRSNGICPTNLNVLGTSSFLFCISLFSEEDVKIS